MINKIIHYCWFGSNKKGSIEYACIESWRKTLPDFTIVEWNEINSQKYFNKFCIQAIRKKKYAFVSDYIRLKVLNEFGGIYLDTDMYILKPLGGLLKYDLFIGKELESRINFAIIGASKDNELIKKCIDRYTGIDFDIYSPPVVTLFLSDIFSYESISNTVKIFDPVYFYPLKYEDRFSQFDYTSFPNSYSVHLWSHSWKNSKRVNCYISLLNVVIDYVFFNYSKSYLKKYSNYFYSQIKTSLKYRFLLLYKFLKT
jgi:mannosyltransferase OCH1-like enzyme